MLLRTWPIAVGWSPVTSQTLTRSSFGEMKIIVKEINERLCQRRSTFNTLKCQGNKLNLVPESSDH